MSVDSGAYLRSSDDSLLLKGDKAYAWLSAVLPMLTGAHSVAEICDGLDESQSRSVASIIDTLNGKSMIRMSSTARDVNSPWDAQRGYLEHFLDQTCDVDAALDRFRSAPILVIDGPTAAYVVTGLLCNGAGDVRVLAADDQGVRKAVRAAMADLAPGRTPRLRVLSALPDTLTEYGGVVIDGNADPAMLREVASAVVTGRAGDAVLVPVLQTSTHGFVGPVSRRGAAGCWLCAQTRWYLNGDGRDDEVVRALALDLPLDGAMRDSTLSAMLGNEAAFTVFRQLTRNEPLDRQVLVQDGVTMESRLSPVVPYAGCPVCGSALHESGDGRLEDLMSPDFGLLVGWRDDDVEQVPLKTGRVEYAIGGGGPAALRTMNGFHVEDILQARDDALARAVIDIATATPRPHGTARGPEIDAVTILGAEGDWPGDHGTLVTGRRLDTGDEVAVPAAAAYARDGARSGFASTTLGIGVGGNWDEAVETAWESALAMRGLDSAVRGTALAAPVDIADVAGEPAADLAYLSGTLERAGHFAHLFSLPSAAPAAAVVAYGCEPGSTWTLGTGPDVPTAAIRALSRLVGATCAGLPVASPWSVVDPAGLRPGPAWSPAGERAVDRSPAALSAARHAAVVVDITPPEVAHLCATRVARVLLTDTARTTDPPRPIPASDRHHGKEVSTCQST